MYRFLLLLLFLYTAVYSQDVAILKYKGGGDWYANPTAIPNLIQFCNSNINTTITEKPETVDANSLDVFNYPILFMTGHGNVFFDDSDVENLRKYLSSGGFLHISDNYGLDKYIRTELEKLFPDSELQEIPYNHAIYNQTYKFESLPKIHEHEGKAPQGFGLFIEGRLVVFYDYESDLSDGWEDEAVHNNPAPIREKALQMGANIIEYAFKN
ncbi:DUF4159 domain-containing protein [Aureibaculum sp. 2210JD6-5]|uniref:DUF4159 domain-containing protein n=1 Tax=Aureibaculum sp. 2210JD6-5 TaxID=3103957 RepID=UPI002AACA6AB|nr:DUF4159 domain-containing protein [Aureibaculum sp. 2210JD6-5]MDY7396603.1 DUF4159 domain-containing protein [Aureibaculum sp. 2210JD6-5]